MYPVTYGTGPGSVCVSKPKTKWRKGKRARQRAILHSERSCRTLTFGAIYSLRIGL